MTDEELLKAALPLLMKGSCWYCDTPGLAQTIHCDDYGPVAFLIAQRLGFSLKEFDTPEKTERWAREYTYP